MRYYICFVVMTALAYGGMARASDAQPFLKIGSTYKVSAPKISREPFHDSSVDSSARVKIIENRNDQWCWVEYDLVSFPPDNKGQVVISKERIWLNFSQMTTVRPLRKLIIKFTKTSMPAA